MTRSANLSRNTALIAGQGLLPVEIAKKLRELQPETLILALREDPETLKPYASRLIHMKTPSLGRGLREIKAFGADSVITRGEANTILRRAQKALNLPEKDTLADKAHNFVSRGDLVKAVCEAFPALMKITPAKNSRIPFKVTKHRNSDYAEILGRLGILNIYSDDEEFLYGRPVTKAEAADIIVRACVEAAK